ncbi:TetR/AcrR family transcriptional regulator [Paenibacillus sp. N1-5-1-14]|uniref:TetR/AcrR family transcriptional regulator n=1 Tax=Paenibacillus radicibacter TaxID=2972488 RepID=UPI002159424D|nr:TetR/AcrR family transcriptional regulator [Paenibacillus radicibacter]MCR8643783.1 TetR/AcrR family transcriptional regulator [Paenibacillus radicibacter]
MKRNKEETNETIQRLLDIARTHFTVHGYAGAALESIVQEANLTRGAVYHHFRNKKELFRSVLEVVQQEVASRVEQEASTSEDVWQQLELGCRAFVLASVEDRNKRIMLIDGPSVLGAEEWRTMDANHSMRLLRGQFEIMQQGGFVKHASLDALTHFVSGALNEIALWLANGTVDENALEDTMHVISLGLEGFKA